VIIEVTVKKDGEVVSTDTIDMGDHHILENELNLLSRILKRPVAFVFGRACGLGVDTMLSEYTKEQLKHQKFAFKNMMMGG